MLVRRAFKFRLAPSAEQAQQLAQGAGCVRFVWNKALALQHERLAKNEKVFSYAELASHLKTWKRTDGTEFLKQPPSQPLQQVLQVSSMSRTAKGTVENPGRNVAAKSGLNKSILDQGWFEFKRQLTYKLLWQGGVLHVVAPHYTSQRCSDCGHTDAANRQTQSQFQCVRCGFELNADENAARNIEDKALGHRVLACESNPTEGRKQEPVRKRTGLKNHKRVSLSAVSRESPSSSDLCA